MALRAVDYVMLCRGSHSMHAMILAVVLTAGSPLPKVDQGSIAAVAETIVPGLQTGTLLFTRGDCLAIKASGGGPYTHVAAVVVRDGVPVLYDSMNGVGVRKLTLEEYLASQAPDEIDVLQPCGAFSEREAEQFEAALVRRLGTHYSVLHYFTGRRSSNGVHCSEYVADALIAAGKTEIERPPRVSPARLAERLAAGTVYTSGERVHFPLEPIATDANDWCEQLWLDTRLCCARCCDKLSGWLLCR